MESKVWEKQILTDLQILDLLKTKNQHYIITTYHVGKSRVNNLSKWILSSTKNYNRRRKFVFNHGCSPKRDIPREKLSTSLQKAEMHQSYFAINGEERGPDGFGGHPRKRSPKRDFPREKLSTSGQKAEMGEPDSKYSDSDYGSDQIHLPNDVYAHLKTFEDISGAPSEPQSEI